MKLPDVRRYGPLARWYDVLSFERLVYRSGRQAMVSELRLGFGWRVLDVGCGTGLNFPLLQAAVGESGSIVGIDASVAMLAGAERRVIDAGWPNVCLIGADAAHLDDALDDALGAGAFFDAVVFTYSLSVISGWETAWRQAFGRLPRGGRVAVLDTAPPTGGGRLFSPLTALAFFTGGVDPRRAPWRRVESDCVEVHTATLRSGHVRLAVGTKPAPRQQGGPAAVAEPMAGR